MALHEANQKRSKRSKDLRQQNCHTDGPDALNPWKEPRFFDGFSTHGRAADSAGMKEDCKESLMIPVDKPRVDKHQSLTEPWSQQY